MWCIQTAAASEGVGMALDKLPDPLPLRRWKQWGGQSLLQAMGHVHWTTPFPLG